MNDPDIIQQLQKCLHPRGIREKQLQKTIQKFEDHTLASCSKTKEGICAFGHSSCDLGGTFNVSVNNQGIFIHIILIGLRLRQLYS